MKQIKDAISALIAKLTNRSFHNGAFPNIVKLAKVKVNQELPGTTIGQFPFFPILGR